MYDFPELSPENFRQLIHKNKEKLEMVSNSKPKIWKIKGIKLSKKDPITVYRTGGGENMIDILDNLKEQPPSIHDIKIKFISDLHSFLISRGYQVNPTNNGIKLDVPKFEDGIAVKILVYPNTVQIDIGCSFFPLIFDSAGVTSISCLLGQIKQYLSHISEYNACISEPNNWIITHYHFGKDGTEVLSGQAFNREWQDAAGGLIRVYSKFKNGSNYARIEQVRTPRIVLEDLAKQVINYERQSNVL
ncbi:MAG: hypothetical protein K5793_04215 [Nitrosarchaeum sp.]|nr:hypothetical protein [Nitrosarchaeum sp.]